MISIHLRRFVAVLFLTCVAAAPGTHAAENPLANAPAGYVEALRDAIQSFTEHQFDKTIAALDRAEALMPPTALTLNTRGAVKIEQRKFDEGAACCRKALEIDPKFFPARFNLCEIPLVQKNYPEARRLFQELRQEHPKDELVQYRILLTYLLEKNDAEARRVLDKLPFPGDTPAYYYGNAAWEFAHDNTPEAVRWMRRANWVFKPEVTRNFSEPFKDTGWMTQDLAPVTGLPEAAPVDSGPMQLGEPAAPSTLEP